VTIAAPRYSGAPLPRLGRGPRILTIARREFLHRSSWPTLLAVAFTFTTVMLITALTVAFETFLGGLTAASFDVAFASPAWPLLLLLVTTAAGAGSIAEDVGSRAFTLYRSRPIRLVDYLVAKTIACGGWLLIAAVGPGLAVVTILGALGYGSTSVVVGAATGFLVVGVVTAIFFTGIALGFSSLTNRPLYAGVTIFGVVLSILIGSTVVGDISGNASVSYADPFQDIQVVAHAAFGASGTTTIDPVGAALVLVGTGVAMWALALVRLGRVEVIAE
jgi:ABC-type transport system involved in multi-copper enzyme maturation permease subunit